MPRSSISPSPTARVAVVCDVHGNLPALDAALAAIRREGADLVAHAGDVVNGPCTAEVVDLLRAEGIAGVYGNHEDYLVRLDSPGAPAAWRAERFAPARWSRASLSPESLAAIAAWPTTSLPGGVADGIALVHGAPGDLRAHFGPRTTDGEAMKNFAGLAAFDGNGGRAIVCGHTHIPHVRRIAGTLVVNAGSAGAPSDGDPRASYALLVRRDVGWDAHIRRVAYDLGAVVDAARRSGWLAEGGGVAASMVHDMLSGRLWTGTFVRWWEARCPDAGSVDAYRRFAAEHGLEALV